jgi:hypothetical protein
MDVPPHHEQNYPGSFDINGQWIASFQPPSEQNYLGSVYIDGQ